MNPNYPAGADAYDYEHPALDPYAPVCYGEDGHSFNLSGNCPCGAIRCCVPGCKEKAKAFTDGLCANHFEEAMIGDVIEEFSRLTRKAVGLGRLFEAKIYASCAASKAFETHPEWREK